MGIINIEPASLGGMRFLFSFYGLSETGKTLSALLVAAGLEPDPKKRMLLDTEGGQRGRAYVNEIAGGYLYANLSPPYTPERYIQALNEIEAAGVTVLVTDSASHSWFAEGGVLAMVEESTVKNDMAKWKDPKRRLGKMMQRYRSSDMHHILCSRAKQPMIEGEVNGRKTYVPGPVVPIQEKMMRYDMTVIAQMLGRGAFTVEAPQGKCPGNLAEIFAAAPLMDEEMGRRLAEWVSVRAALSPEVRALKTQAAEIAALGIGAYGEFWEKLDRTGRAALLAEHDNLKSIAKTADDERARGEADTEKEEQAEHERTDPNLDDPFGGKKIEHVGEPQEDAFGLKPLPENSPPAQPVHERNTGGSGGPAPGGEPDQSASRPASSPGPTAGPPGADATLPAGPPPVEDVSRRGGDPERPAERGEGSARPFATTDTAPSGGNGGNGDNRTRGGNGPTATTDASRSDTNWGRALDAAADERLNSLRPALGNRENAANVSDRPQSPSQDSLHTEAPFPGDLLGDPAAENLTVPVPRNPDLDHVYRQMMDVISGAPNDTRRLARIKLANPAALAALKTGAVAQYDEVQAALARRPA